MKTKTMTFKSLWLSIIFSMMTLMASAQCEPMGPDECPDPDNNGEICPDTMPLGYLNQVYSEAATILVPEEDTTGIAIHHLTLIDIDNLPTGLSWVSNAPDNEFMAGEYYCILLEGTPEVVDTFYLKIVIDVYIDWLGQPVLITQMVDSTSLSMVIREEAGVNEIGNNIEIVGNYPNPFSGWTNISFTSKGNIMVSFEVYSLMGEKIHEQKMGVRQGDNNILYSGEGLGPGTYFYVLRNDNSFISRPMIRIK